MQKTLGARARPDGAAGRISAGLLYGLRLAVTAQAAALLVAAAFAGQAAGNAAMAEAQRARETPRLPGVVLPPGLACVSDLAALGEAAAVLMVLPAQATVGAVAGLREETAVTAPHGGTVVEWLVHDGDLVSPGQPLVRLHPEGGGMLRLKRCEHVQLTCV